MKYFKIIILFLFSLNISFSLLMPISDYKVIDRKVVTNNNVKLNNVDIDTFQTIGLACAKDKNNVYFGNQIIENIDAETFVEIQGINGSLYYKDKYNVYFTEINELVKLDNVDIKTFVVYDHITAGDKNNKYFRSYKLINKKSINEWEKNVELILEGSVFAL